MHDMLLVFMSSLFSATLALLQDEDPQVRSEAADALPLRSAGPQNLFKKLVLAFEGDSAQLVKFLWRELCRSGPSALCEFQQLAKPTVASLFEQDESGVFMEPMVVSHMLHRGTQMALEGALQGSTDLMSFLLDEALRLADELMAVSQAIGEFTLLTDKPLGTNLEILARPKLHHAIAVLRARADLVEWACAHFIAEPRPGATAETLRPGKEVVPRCLEEKVKHSTERLGGSAKETTLCLELRGAAFRVEGGAGRGG
ncbi:hypothetical protein HPB51_007138 [Rhipicephalus microplus]|uniref:Uncharacterized protein n=1 Tax=Rhipicephalus microplus TaxID=6941 RepID=A0A9J6DZW8_RHIMP|nr:hypothetical protein HPB51_007138 [Rhipicephalus microplus]